ncbi:MAG: hypothetical protein GY716_03090 [bacterium]|nr:hypothetical protein [bacterium]
MNLSDLRAVPPLYRIAGRNQTKADILVYSVDGLEIAIKDYTSRPWFIRNTLGRLLIRRESAVYRAAGGAEGLPRFLGRLGPFALATERIPGRMLREFADHTVDAEILDRLEAILRRLHELGVALGDLTHRDVLVGDDGAVHVVDLAMSWIGGPGSGRLRQAVFVRFVEKDLFALVRLRDRFVRPSDPAADERVTDRAVRWHRRGRRIKQFVDWIRGKEHPE